MDVLTASTIYGKTVRPRPFSPCVSQHGPTSGSLTNISTSSPECNHWSRAQQNSLLNDVCGCLCEPCDGNVGRLKDGDCGGELRARCIGGSGEGGSETATLDEEDVSEWLRSSSVSNGFSSSNPVSIVRGEKSVWKL